MKSDKWIKEQEGMIEPFIDHTVREVDGHKACSFGLSCAGYDIRLADDIYVRHVKEVDGALCDAFDPKGGDASFVETEKLEVYEDEKGRYVYVRPGVAFGHTVEVFKMPRNVVGFLMPKSTYARCGIFISAPLVEPNYEGSLAVTFCNMSSDNVRVYLGEGFAQMVFFDAGEVEIAYDERGGLYGGKNMQDIQFARV